jgi:hypothetical protein
MAARASDSRRGAAFRAFAALALSVLALALLASAPVAAAAKAPPLAETAQYKAFVDYVKKLDGLAGRPTTEEQKAKYETELGAKRTAAAHKANALFKRSSAEAKAEFDARFKEQAAVIHNLEEDELEGVASDYAAKLDRAGASLQLKLARVDNGRQTFEASLHERIDALRDQKAQTPNAAGKAAVQERIAALIAQIASKRRELARKRADLKTAFRDEKQELQAAQAKKEAEIAAAAEAKVAKISKHWKAAYADKHETLDAKRASQLAYLAAKLEKGRTDIASMPGEG